MRTIIKWDKESPINGRPAEKIHSDNPSYATAPIYLVVKNERVEMIENARIIRNNHNLTGTDDEVMKQYLDMLNGVEPQTSISEPEPVAEVASEEEDADVNA